MSQPAKRPTIRDVARAAGVSVATVSRALSGDYPVSTATRARIQRAVRDLDYVVNAHARALSGATSKIIAIVTPEAVTPFFAYIAQGVEQEAAAHGRLCLVCTTHGDTDRELEIFQLIGNGFGTRQIAEKLHLSVKTIESYRESLKQKLKLKDRSELIQQAIHWARGEGPMT